MNREEATSQDVIDRVPLLKCEGKWDTIVGQIAARSTSELHGKQVQYEISDCKSIKEEEHDIKIKLEDVPYTEEYFVDPEFVLSKSDNEEMRHSTDGEQMQDEMLDSISIKEEELDIKIEFEDVHYTGEPDETDFVLPEECAIIVKAEEIVHPKSSALANKVRHSCFRKYVFTNIECPHCPYKTNNKQAFNIHKVVHIPYLTAPIYKCSECSFRSSKLTHVNRHCWSTHQKGNYWYQCSKCSFRSKWLQSINFHYLSEHKKPDEITWHSCPECPFRGKYLQSVKHHYSSKHKKTMKSDKVTLYKCSECPFRSKWLQSLNVHFLSQHKKPDETTWHSCPECPFRGKYLQSVKQHYSSKHKKSRMSIQN